MFEFRRQPLKTLYSTYFILSTLFIRVPVWLFLAIPPFLRPRSTWTFKRAFAIRGIRAYIATWYSTSFPVEHKYDPENVAASADAEAVGFTWVDPIPSELLVGEIRDIAKTNGVDLAKTCGYWFTRQGQKNATDDKVILHLHGGGYVVTSAHPNGGGNAPTCGGFLEHFSNVTRVFGGAYRLSSSAPFEDANPLPAALLDAAASYYYLIHTVRLRPEQIIISGDSAGGHLALSLVRYLAMNQFPSMPVPGALLLLSPTVEWAITHLGENSSMVRNKNTDYCNLFFEGYTRRSLLGKLPSDAAATNAWISPASLKLENVGGLFKGLPKTYLLAGDAEVCLDSYRTLRDRLVADIGEENLRYNEVKDATHDFITMTWHEPERTMALKDIGVWIQTL